MDLNQVTLPCTNYDDTVRFYRQLGFRRIVDSPPRYGRFDTDHGTTFSIHAENASGNPQAFVVYFEVADVAAPANHLKDKGSVFERDPVD